MIGLFGFEGGLVLNDYVDRKRDRLDVEGSLTGYWRPFKDRPLPSGRISPDFALAVFLLLSALTGIFMFTLPYPNSLYVFLTMLSSCILEYFYQVKRKNPESEFVCTFPFSCFTCALFLLDYSRFFPLASKAQCFLLQSLNVWQRRLPPPASRASGWKGIISTPSCASLLFVSVLSAIS